MIVLGADPDANGAVVRVRDLGASALLVTWARVEDPHALIGQLAGIVAVHGRPQVVYVEGGLTVPRDARKLRSVAVYQRSVGAMHAAVHALGCRVVQVQPQRWQRALGLNHLWGVSSTRRKRETHRVAVSHVQGAGDVPVYAGDALALAVYGLMEERMLRRAT